MAGDPASPRKAIEEAYINCLQARQRWNGLDARFRDEDLRAQAHADLHESVMNWFEALLPFMSDAEGGMVADFYNRAPLWPTQPVLEDALQCIHCDAIYQSDEKFKQLDGGTVPVCDDPIDGQECGKPLEFVNVYATDRDGKRLFEWAQGLRKLSAWTGKSEVTIQKSGKFRPTKKKVVSPQLLKPEVLLRVARYLDQVAEQLGLLTEVSEEESTAHLSIQEAPS